jgi:hypothetical protein
MEGQNNERKFSNMKNRNTQLTAVLFVVALALAPIVQAAPHPDGGPVYLKANEAPQLGGGPNYPPGSTAIRPPANDAPQPGGIPSGPPANEAPVSAPDTTNPQDVQMPAIIINSTGDVNRGKTGSFVLDMKPRLVFGAMFVNFKVSGTAIPGVDYVALVSPAYIGQSGYGTILVQTLPDPRGSANRQSYSVVVTLESGPGYELGSPSSATMWIKP